MNARAVLAVVIALVMWLAWPAGASAQVYTGRIDVQVQDASGGILPGTTVELTGPLTQSAVTDSVGQAHFLNLPLGTYKVTAQLAGFADYASPPLLVEAGAAVPLRVTLGVGGVQEQLVVTGEAPLIDTRKQTTGLNLSQEELQQLPSTRDWSSATQAVPSVSTDRVNVGGSESGSQSNMFAKGASNLQNTVNVDGVVVTDGSAGMAMASPDFDMFQEIQVTTGGASTTNPSFGVQVNLVLKSGANTPHGSTRFLYENSSLQSDNLTDELKAELGTEEGNRIDHYKDYGFEAGGPVLKDRWWIWGGAGKLDLMNITLNGYPDPTTLSTVAFKTSWQVTPAIRPSFSYFRTRYDKPQYGIGPSVPPEVALNLIVGSDLYKAESNFVIGKNLFLTGRASYMKVD